MATDIVRPNQDYNCNWAGPHSANIDEVVEQPTAGDGSVCKCDKNDDGEIEEFGMSTFSNVTDVSQIVVWIYGRAENVGVQPDIDIYFDGGYETAQTANFTTSNSWKSFTFGSLSGDQAALDALRVRFTAAGSVSPTSEWYLDTMYCVVTYTGVSVTPKGFAQTAQGDLTTTTPYREMGTSNTAEGTMAVITPYRALGFAATGEGSMVVVNPYREMGFSATGSGDGVFILLADKAFFATGSGSDVFTEFTTFLNKSFAATGAGSDVFGYQTVGATMVYFEATGTGSDSFTTPYRALGFTDTGTGTAVLMVPYQDMGMMDDAYTVAEFIKSAISGDRVVFIYIDPQYKVNTTSEQFHQMTATIENQQKIKMTAEMMTQ